MTRRLSRRARTPGVDAYVRRATLGLPRGERLDAAAELRAHLLDRVAELETQGFSRDEAEYLAVRGMGKPEVTNRQLLGHVLTTPLGWGVLVALGAGLIGWQFRAQPMRPAVRVVAGSVPQPLVRGGLLPTSYVGFQFKTPPGTRYVQLAWIGPQHTEQAILPATASSPADLWVGLPTWRAWWATRTPLPYADLPWRESCRQQKPVHVSMTTRAGDGFRPGLVAPGSNLTGVLWCSGLRTLSGELAAGDHGATGSYRYVGDPWIQTQAVDGTTDQGRLRLNHWTTLFAMQESTSRGAQAAILVVRPATFPGEGPPPVFRYVDERWNVREVSP